MVLRAGIIGLGVGEQHIAGFQSHPACEVVALCDHAEEKRKRASLKYPGIRIAAFADEILEDPKIDVVSIASYDSDHYQHAVKAIENGKHVFVEKPVCLEESQASHLQALLRAHPDLKFSSNLIMRQYPRFKRLRQMIQEGAFGRLFLIEGDYNFGRLNKITEGWRGKLDFYSVVYGGGVHLVDLFLWLTQDTVVEVTAYGNQIASEGTQFRFNDLVVCLLKFESGMVGKIAVNFGCVYPHFHRLSIYGTEKTFTNEPQGAYLYSSREPSVPPAAVQDDYPGAAKGDLIRSFVDSIVQNRDPEVTPDEIFKAMAVCFAIEESVKQSQKVKVQYQEQTS